MGRSMRPRIIVGLAILGACMGFLPHNFNPAVIFLGDTGSLLLGYCSALMILSLGDTGQTSSGVRGGHHLLDPDHRHRFSRSSGGSSSGQEDVGSRRGSPAPHAQAIAWVSRARCFALYGIGIVFCVLGVLLSQVPGAVYLCTGAARRVRTSVCTRSRSLGSSQLEAQLAQPKRGQRSGDIESAVRSSNQTN